MSLEAHFEGYSFLMNESRDAMTKAASKATKLEKRLGVTLGGYQARAHALAKHKVGATRNRHPLHKHNTPSPPSSIATTHSSIVYI